MFTKETSRKDAKLLLAGIIVFPSIFAVKIMKTATKVAYKN